MVVVGGGGGELNYHSIQGKKKIHNFSYLFLDKGQVAENLKQSKHSVLVKKRTVM